MMVGITKFPGTNNELDVAKVLRSLDIPYRFLFPSDNSLSDLDAIVIAGGFSYGDYLRAGVLASHTPLMYAIKEFASSGHFVIGICNGFQILCESRILPGVLTPNLSTHFISKWVYVRVESTSSPLLVDLVDDVLMMPIAHYEGRYYAPSSVLSDLRSNNQIALRYCDANGVPNSRSNPNGSIDNIAGIVNRSGNVLGLMPHPERASFDYLGSTDGRKLFENLLEVVKC